MRQEHREPVLEHLADIYDDIDDSLTLADTFHSIAKQLAAEYYIDNAREIRYRAEDSFLEDFDDSNLGAAFEEALSNSITYTLMSRCSFDTADHFDDDDFQYIYNFNTPDMECILESVKVQILNVASLEEIIASRDSQDIINAKAKQYATQIDDNERKINQINNFKSSLYENLISGIISKEDYKKLKEKYADEENPLREANAVLQKQLEDVLAGKSESLKLAEHFKRFDDMTEIDRRTVVSLIHSIKIKSKTALEITFNYQSEYERALALIRKEVA